MNLSGKTALVTGGSSGLGLEIARKLVEKGMVVYITGRNEEKLMKAKESIGSDNLITMSIDATYTEEMKFLADKLERIDVLINNAGLWLGGYLEDNNDQQISDVIDANVKGVIYTTKYILPKMKLVNDGFIINVSSTSGVKPKPESAVYTASKFAIQGFTESLKIDLKSTNVKVVGFYPGGMATDFFDAGGDPKDTSKWMQPSDVAETICFILERPDSMLIDHIVLQRRK